MASKCLVSKRSSVWYPFCSVAGPAPPFATSRRRKNATDLDGINAQDKLKVE